MKVPLKNLEPWSPFDSVVWAYCIEKPITREEVTEAIRNGRFVDKPFPKTLDAMFCVTREEHVQRVAFLVKNGWDDKIVVDVGVPSLGCHIDWIVDDGNHRLAAAFYRGDKDIDVSVSGCIDYAAELLGVSAEEIERQLDEEDSSNQTSSGPV